MPSRPPQPKVEQIRRLFPAGPLPEEPPRNAEMDAWPWGTPTAARPAVGGVPLSDAAHRAIGELASVERQFAIWATQPTALVSGMSDPADRPTSDRATVERQLAASTGQSKPRLASAKEAWRGWMDRHLSPDGFLLADPWRTDAVLPALARCWLASESRTVDDEAALGQVIDAVCRMARADGRYWGSPAHPPLSKGYRKFLASFADEVRSHETRALLKLAAGGTRASGDLPEPGFQSDEAGIALLRAGWRTSDAALALDFRGPTIRVEWWVLGTRLIVGAWNTRASAEGRAIELPGTWDAICWFAGSDGQYLELRRLIGGGLLLERQFFLPRRLPMLWISDTLRSPRPEPLELAWDLEIPLARSIRNEGNSRAKSLEGPPAAIRVLPVGGPADPMAPSPMSLDLKDGHLAVTTRADGTRLFMPLVFCWDRAALAPQADWRQLHITNDRRDVPPSEAVAYRVPIAGKQFVFYRALGPARRAAFLGHQTFHECVIGVLNAKGDLDQWTVIE